MGPSQEETVRPSAIAGTWYPGSAPVLRATIEGYLDEAYPAPLPGRVLMLVCPHAGYTYAGPTAAHAYALLRGAPFRRVVLFGPLHRPIRGSRLGPFMVPSESAYRTPLGDVPVDRSFLAELARRVHLTPVRNDEEHALEIELPFLQVALSRFVLVPMMFGEYIAETGVPERLSRLAGALAGLCDEETLLVVSTDLSHMDDYADVVRTDRRLTDLVAVFDVNGLCAALHAEEVQACGATGLVAALRTAELLGAQGARVLAYTTSGDVTGDKRPGRYTVGYLAAAVYR